MAIQLVILGCSGVLLAGDDQASTPLPGAPAALARLTHAGYDVAVLVGLPPAASHSQALDALGQRVTVLQREVTAAGGVVDAFFACTHGVRQPCSCRPPQSGLFEQVANRWRVELARVPAALAAADELAAAHAAGCNVVAIGAAAAQGRHCADLGAFVDALLEEGAGR